MKWIKASEEKPPTDNVVPVLWRGYIIGARYEGEIKKDGITAKELHSFHVYALNKYSKKYLSLDEVIWLDESTLSKGEGKEDELQAEWEFLTIIKANRDILKNADSKVAFPNHSAKSAALEVYKDMIDIISNLPCKRSPTSQPEGVKASIQYCEGEDDIAFDFHEANKSGVSSEGMSKEDMLRPKIYYGIIKGEQKMVIHYDDALSAMEKYASSLLTQRDETIRELKVLIERLYKSENWLKLSADEQDLFWNSFKKQNNL